MAVLKTEKTDAHNVLPPDVSSPRTVCVLRSSASPGSSWECLRQVRRAGFGRSPGGPSSARRCTPSEAAWPQGRRVGRFAGAGVWVVSSVAVADNRRRITGHPGASPCLAATRALLRWLLLRSSLGGTSRRAARGPVSPRPSAGSSHASPQPAGGPWGLRARSFHQLPRPRAAGSTAGHSFTSLTLFFVWASISEFSPLH